MRSKKLSPRKAQVLYRVQSPDRKDWYGTFKTKAEAEKHMKQDWPEDKYEITEVEQGAKH